MNFQEAMVITGQIGRVRNILDFWPEVPEEIWPQLSTKELREIWNQATFAATARGIESLHDLSRHHEMTLKKRMEKEVEHRLPEMSWKDMVMLYKNSYPRTKLRRLILGEFTGRTYESDVWLSITYMVPAGTDLQKLANKRSRRSR